MARIRTIKPEFWTSEQVADCSPTARLLFIGMWNFCDDGGVHPASYKRIKMEVFPGDNLTDAQVKKYIDELINAGLIMEYSSQGQSYWYVTGWSHQKIDKPISRHPLPSLADRSTNSRIAVGEESTTAHPRNGMESNGMESNGEEIHSCRSEPDDSGKEIVIASIEKEFFEHWNEHVEFSQIREMNRSRRSALKSRLKEKFFSDNWREAITRIRGSPFLRGENQSGWKATVDWFLKPTSCLKVIERSHGVEEETLESENPFL